MGTEDKDRTPSHSNLQGLGRDGSPRKGTRRGGHRYRVMEIKNNSHEVTEPEAKKEGRNTEANVSVQCV